MNEGEIPQYYVKNNHEAIIEPEIFDLVQKRLALRTKGKIVLGQRVFSHVSSSAWIVVIIMAVRYGTVIRNIAVSSGGATISTMTTNARRHILQKMRLKKCSSRLLIS
ncbi:hypothetical protein SAMN02745116_02466 [Pilibacter termitis]|uniref:Uncharacterized protein n=1 Tax=Pilibacter termitis TaxID=263852 RepID=A0A1T4R7Y9_9ENTE|nr:hypothetical protein SAMN02745116_02466 [Pilibacter termitis]